MIERWRRDLFAYQKRIASELGLHEWTFILEDGEPKGNEFGSKPIAGGSVLYFGDETTVRYSAKLLDMEAAHVRQTIVHEVMHCFVHRMYQDANDAFGAFVPGLVPQTLADAYRSTRFDQYERTVERLALAVARFMPLIPWPPAYTQGSPTRPRAKGAHR